MREGEAIVRRNFKRAFAGDSLLISREELFQEIKEVINMCRRLSKRHRVAVVSHSFRLKFIEAFLKTGGGLEKGPELIEDYILDN